MTHKTEGILQMSLANDIANKSIREAIQTLAVAVDGISTAPAVNTAKVEASVQELRADFEALKLEVDGAPATPPVDQPLPPISGTI